MKQGASRSRWKAATPRTVPRATIGTVIVVAVGSRLGTGLPPSGPTGVSTASGCRTSEPTGCAGPSARTVRSAVRRIRRRPPPVGSSWPSSTQAHRSTVASWANPGTDTSVNSSAVRRTSSVVPMLPPASQISASRCRAANASRPTPGSPTSSRYEGSPAAPSGGSSPGSTGSRCPCGSRACTLTPEPPSESLTVRQSSVALRPLESGTSTTPLRAAPTSSAAASSSASRSPRPSSPARGRLPPPAAAVRYGRPADAKKERSNRRSRSLYWSKSCCSMSATASRTSADIIGCASACQQVRSRMPRMLPLSGSRTGAPAQAKDCNRSVKCSLLDTVQGRRSASEVPMPLVPASSSA